MTAAKVPKEPKATEAEMLDLLERRHAAAVGGVAGHAFMRLVRNDGSFDATRTFDGVAVDLWKSRGYTIHIFEVKVSRSDWLRELAKPDKSDDACRIADYYSIVAPRGCVNSVDEVPPTWGYIEAAGGVADPQTGTVTGRKLRTIRQAPLLTPRAQIKNAGDRSLPRGLVISMLRAAGAVPDGQTVSEKALAAARNDGWTEAWETAEKSIADAHADLDRLRVLVRRFETGSGLTIQGWGYRDLLGAQDHSQIDELAARVRAAMADDGQEQRVRANLQRLRGQLLDQAGQLEAILGPVTADG